MRVIVEQSRITSKGQTTVPRAVRQALGVQPGDAIAFRIEDDGVRVERASSSEDPALAAFLDFLARDLAQRPEAISAVSPALRARIARLTTGVAADLDTPIEGDVAI